MPRALVRQPFIPVALAALAVLVYALLQPRPSFPPLSSAFDTPGGSTLTTSSGPDTWSMEGYDLARTRALEHELSLPLDNRQELTVPDDKGTGSPLTIAGNTVLVDSEHVDTAERSLRAIDLTTGEEGWSFPIAGHHVSPAVAGDLVLVRAETANRGQVIAFDLETGTLRWTFPPRRLSSASTGYWGGHLTAPLVVDGKLLIAAGKELYAVDAGNGAILWEYGAEDFVSASVSVGGGKAYFSDAANAYAIDHRTGKLLWKTPIEFSVYFAPVVAGDTVVLTSGKRLVALDVRDGRKLWEQSAPEDALVPAAAQGSVVLAKTSSTLWAFDRRTGERLWQYADPNFVSIPAVAGQQVYAVQGARGQTRLTVLELATGKPLWEQAIPELATIAPVIAGDTVYLRTNDGGVLALSD